MFEALALTDPLAKLFLAASLGAFLGLRREIRAHENHKERSFTGFRTMILVASLGAVSTFFKDMPYLPIIFFGALSLLISIAYANGSFNLKRIGITTELSTFLVFWMGVLVGLGESLLAIMITIFLAIINAFKSHIHGFAHTLNETEWKGALQLFILSAAVLPFLPQIPIDPWGVFVPFKIWLLVILISGIGFLGYFLIKYFGARGGIPLTGFLGAIISSTGVTTSMATQSKKSNFTGIFAVGILIALGTMQLRVLGEIVFLGTEDFLNRFLLVPVTMAVASGVSALYFFKKTTRKHWFFQSKDKDIIKLEQPFELAPALKFGAIFVLILFALAFGQKHFGDSGVYIAAIFSGIIDIDAIVLSGLESVRLGELTPNVAQNAIAIALFVNTAVKILYVMALGSSKLVKKITTAIIFITAVGGITFLLI
jgi:uncharacterized membrane protein (DUF4010 family)